MTGFMTKHDLVYRRLKAEILAGRLRPGERLVVSDLARRFEVSPMPVREALVRLQQDELVDVIPHIGAKVVPFNLRKFVEIAAIRVELETLAANLATHFLTEDQIADLADLVELMQGAVEQKDNASYEAMNRKFHIQIYTACQNQQLIELIMSLWEKSEISQTIFTRLVNRTAVSIKEHEQWLQAIRERNPEKVAAVVRRHKETAFKRLAEVLGRDGIDGTTKTIGAEANR